jgi:hypothetical protein
MSVVQMRRLGAARGFRGLGALGQHAQDVYADQDTYADRESYVYIDPAAPAPMPESAFQEPLQVGQVIDEFESGVQYAPQPVAPIAPPAQMWAYPHDVVDTVGEVISDSRSAFEPFEPKVSDPASAQITDVALPTGTCGWFPIALIVAGVVTSVWILRRK